MSDEPPLEDRLLGGIIAGLYRQSAAVEPALTDLEPGHFADPANRRVFAAVAHLRRVGVAVDLASVADHLLRSGEIDAAGGPVRLCELWDLACDPAELPALVARLNWPR